MRLLTILVSLLVGVILCLVFLNNPQIVPFNFTRMLEGRGYPSVHPMPLWQIVFGSVALGLALGYLMGATGRTSSRESRRAKSSSRNAVIEDEGEDVDYVLGIRSDRRR